MKHSEQTEKFLHDSKEIVKKINIGFKSVKEKANAVASKISSELNGNVRIMCFKNNNNNSYYYYLNYYSNYYLIFLLFLLCYYLM